MLKAESRNMLRNSVKQILYQDPSLPSTTDDKHHTYFDSNNSDENKDVPTTNSGLLTKLTQLIWRNTPSVHESESEAEIGAPDKIEEMQKDNSEISFNQEDSRIIKSHNSVQKTSSGFYSPEKSNDIVTKPISKN